MLTRKLYNVLPKLIKLSVAYILIYYQMSVARHFNANKALLLNRFSLMPSVAIIYRLLQLVLPSAVGDDGRVRVRLDRLPVAAVPGRHPLSGRRRERDQVCHHRLGHYVEGQFQVQPSSFKRENLLDLKLLGL